MKNTKQDIIRWAKTWQRSGNTLKRIKIEELQDPKYFENNKDILNDMLENAAQRAHIEITSGLVELQLKFKRIRDATDMYGKK